MSDKQSDYEKYLASLHNQLHTSDEIIHDVVKEGTGLDLISKEKIIAGEANEVYDITLSNNNHVILRISKQGNPNFQQEKWAIEQVKKVGVPAPEILLIIYKTIDGQEHSFCLMEKVDGEPLERGNMDFNKLSEQTRKSYIIQAGEILSKIHSIKTKGYGWISGEKSEFETIDEVIEQIVKMKESLYQFADKHTVDQTMNIVEKYKIQYASLPTFLNHGDYSHKHFMVKNHHIVSIIDWGGVRSDSPIMEFAAWDYWFGEYIPTLWLMEGYQNKQLFNNEFEEMLHFLRIIRGIEVISWYSMQNYKQGVQLALKKLKDDVEYFG